MMIKGNDPENIKVGSTLATDEFAAHKFDFMFSNPPYGESWASDLKYIKDGKDIIDPRFQIKLKNYWGIEEEVDATPPLIRWPVTFSDGNGYKMDSVLI
jgi:type I restriction enzyme M protein